jgi:hypothetical protein
MGYRLTFSLSWRLVRQACQHDVWPRTEVGDELPAITGPNGEVLAEAE